jgi:hypothetical protein
VKVHTFKQYSEEWWEYHRGKPSASNFSKIITPAKGDYSKSGIDYVCELIAELYDPFYGPQNEYASAAMRNGTIMEPEARRFYEFERDCDVQQVGLCETDDGRFISSPDALCGDDGCLELKSPGYKTHIKYLLAGGLPAEYKPQCHGHLLVTQRHWCDFMSYCRGLPPVLVRVVPDDYTLRLAEALEQFWKEYSAMRAKIEGGREEVIAAAMAGAVPQESYF